MGIFTSKEEKEYYRLKKRELIEKQGWCLECGGDGSTGRECRTGLYREAGCCSYYVSQGGCQNCMDNYPCYACGGTGKASKEEK